MLDAIFLVTGSERLPANDETILNRFQHFERDVLHDATNTFEYVNSLKYSITRCVSANNSARRLIRFICVQPFATKPKITIYRMSNQLDR